MPCLIIHTHEVVAQSVLLLWFLDVSTVASRAVERRLTENTVNAHVSHRYSRYVTQKCISSSLNR